MYYFISVLLIIIAVLLILIVLVQNSKGGGLAANFAGSNQYMGVRKTTDFLEKATWALISIFFFLTIMAVYTMPHPDNQVQKSELQEKISMDKTVNAPAPSTIPTTTTDDKKEK